MAQCFLMNQRLGGGDITHGVYAGVASKNNEKLSQYSDILDSKGKAVKWIAEANGDGSNQTRTYIRGSNNGVSWTDILYLYAGGGDHYVKTGTNSSYRYYRVYASIDGGGCSVGAIILQ